jgi:hypothetical protein
VQSPNATFVALEEEAVRLCCKLLQADALVLGWQNDGNRLLSLTEGSSWLPKILTFPEIDELACEAADNWMCTPALWMVMLTA